MTRPQKNDKISCFDLLEEYRYSIVLRNPKEYTLNIYELKHLLTESTLISQLQLAQLATTLFAINCHHLYAEILSTPEIIHPLRQQWTKIFFLPHTFHSISLHFPNRLSEFSKFQAKIFTIERFPISSDLANNFFANLIPASTLDNTLKENIASLFLNFLRFSFDLVLDEEVGTQKYYYSQALLLSICALPHSFYYQILLLIHSFEPKRTFYSALISTQLQTFYYGSKINHETTPCFFNLLFSNPELCSFVFTESNRKYLPFCDVEKSIAEAPDLFV